MSIVTTRDQRRQLARDNAKQPIELQIVPRDQWPNPSATHLRVFRSRDFLVQEFAGSAPASVRLSVCRTTMAGDRWQDGISWDDLQRLKRECGYGELWAVEVYPPDSKTVNVASMRHLFLVPESSVPFAWGATKS